MSACFDKLIGASDPKGTGIGGRRAQSGARGHDSGHCRVQALGRLLSPELSSSLYRVPAGQIPAGGQASFQMEFAAEQSVCLFSVWTFF